MQDNSGSQGSVNSRFLLRPRAEAANQSRKRPRGAAPNAPPEPEPSQKRSRWHLPGVPREKLSPKQNVEAPAVPSGILGRSSKAPVTQKRGKAGQRKAPISKGKLVIADSPKESSKIQKPNRRNPPSRKVKKLKQPPALSTSPSQSPAKSEDFVTPRVCMCCESCQKSQQNPPPGSAAEEESADNMTTLSDIGSSNVDYVTASVRSREESVNWNRSPVRLQEETHFYPDRRPMKYCDYINYVKEKSRRLLAARDS